MKLVLMEPPKTSAMRMVALGWEWASLATNWALAVGLMEVVLIQPWVCAKVLVLFSTQG
jgi:hypothetical protein